MKLNTLNSNVIRGLRQLVFLKNKFDNLFFHHLKEEHIRDVLEERLNKWNSTKKGYTVEYYDKICELLKKVNDAIEEKNWAEKWLNKSKKEDQVAKAKKKKTKKKQASKSVKKKKVVSKKKGKKGKKKKKK